MNQKRCQNMCHANVKVNLVVKNVIQIKSGITVDVIVSAKIQKHAVCEKNFIWNSSICTCENCKYLEGIIGDSLIMCDKIIEVTKTIPTKTTLTKKGNP